MSQPDPKQGDKVVAVCRHIVLVAAPPGAPVPTPLPHLFNGMIDNALSANANITSMPPGTLISVADNIPPHLPTPPGTSFLKPPTNTTIITGSPTAFINDKPAARNGDTALTCNRPVDFPVSSVVAVGTAFIG